MTASASLRVLRHDDKLDGCVASGVAVILQCRVHIGVTYNVPLICSVGSYITSASSLHND